ncbi:MAG: contractile injection system protein, VgrG/Pvc8 family [Bacillota bacterium]|nr:contractile injection system protein, VgrG/Pvc8 family [Bacillota bacterium]
MSGSNILAGHEIQIMPYNIHPTELTIVRRINDHVKVNFTAIVPEGQKDKYIQMTDLQSKIEINHNGKSSSTPLFKGIVTNIEVRSYRDVYYLEVEAVSYSYNLDIKLKRRSFQDKDMAFTDLIKKVLGDYPGADFIDEAAKSSKLEKFIIQYDETDWEFLIRMASRFNVGLVPDPISDKPKFWFGAPDGGSKGNLEEFNFSVSKKISDFRYSSENFIKGIDDKDFIYYKVETDNILNIGDSISFQKKNLYVYESIGDLNDGVFKHEYSLSPKKGLSQDLLLHEKAAGCSVEGKVIDIKEDNIRVHLEIDKEQAKDKAFWFPYSTFYTTEGNTGWYCMPELDDLVKLYFPTNKEEEGIITNSIRRRTKGGDFIMEPDVKIFRTKFGKEIMFNDKEIMISAKDKEILIRLIEDKGIEIYSKKDIKIVADKGISMESGKTIQMSAGSAIGIKCKDSLIEMNGVTTIKGSQVKTN